MNATSASGILADSADVIGNVVLGDSASIWFNAVVRGDNDTIEIGARTNVQDGAVLHADPGIPLIVGNGVTIGHQAMLHGCRIGDNSLIGIGASVLNNAVIGNNCIVPFVKSALFDTTTWHGVCGLVLLLGRSTKRDFRAAS